MDAAKTSLLLMSQHAYEDKGRKTFILKPCTDVRGLDKPIEHMHFGPIVSRLIKGDTQALYLEPGHWRDAEDLIKDAWAVYVDEVQFCSTEDIWWLSDLVDNKNIPVMAYGLKTTSDGKLFEGSAALLAIADEMEERRSVCSFCGKRANMHVCTSGQGGAIGSAGCEGNGVTYKSVCRRCFKKFQNGEIKITD